MLTGKQSSTFLKSPVPT